MDLSAEALDHFARKDQDETFEGNVGFKKNVNIEGAALFADVVEHGIFGYSIMPDTWSQSYVNWWDKRHHITLNPDKLIFTTGVVPAISSAVRKLTTPAENVLVQTPTYNIFFNSIRNNGRNIVENHLLYDGREYHIDWETLEHQLADPQTSLLILCNPHNPIGKIWDKETLARIGALCAENDVTVFSDEIHCDITAPGTEYGGTELSPISVCSRVSGIPDHDLRRHLCGADPEYFCFG